jgi:spermidine synthase
LNENAVVSLSLPPTPDYVSSEEEQMNSVMYNTLKKVFKNTIIIPGGKNYFISSDDGLSYEITKKIDERNIDNIYVNKYYLDEPSIIMRANNIMSSINKNSMLNQDFRPISYYNQILYWISYFKLNYWLLLGIFLIPFIIILIRLKPINLGLFTEGFTASVSEIVLLLSFQIIYGYVYHFIGIIIMLFMLGLTIGSFYIYKNEKFIKIKNFITIHAVIIVYIILLPFILILINSPELNTTVIFAAFFFLILIVAILTGVQFAIASKMSEKEQNKISDKQTVISSIASSAYSADLFGSALGAVAVSGFLIPLYGIMSVCIITGILNLISGIVIFVKRKKYI